MSNAVAKLDFTEEQMALIESQCFPAGTSKTEKDYCLSVARELSLNPITKEIFFISRRQKVGDRWVSKVEPMVGRDAFLSIAHRSNQLAGMESTACIRDVPQLENGRWTNSLQLVAECTVWRKDSPKHFTVQVSFNEYCQKSSEGNITKFWAEKPETMLKKVAESQALRKSFNISGVYCPEELGAGFELANGDIVIQAVEMDSSKKQTDKSHLSVVKPQAETPPVRQSKQKAQPADSHQPTTPTPPVTSEEAKAETQPESSKVKDDAALKVIELLTARKISYDIAIDGIDGFITAKSYNDKEVLKSSGFRWSSDRKCWVYKFRNEPF